MNASFLTGERWRSWQPWIGSLIRLVLAAVWIVAGGIKVPDLAAAGRSVVAYKIMPADLALVVGRVLPFVEIVLGLLLLAGLATRMVAIATAGLFVAYIAGISSVWARGLSIDCGCFGGGGATKHPTYLWEVLRDTGLLLLAVFLVRWPRTRYAVDGWIAPDLDEFIDADDETTDNDGASADDPAYLGENAPDSDSDSDGTVEAVDAVQGHPGDGARG